MPIASSVVLLAGDVAVALAASGVGSVAGVCLLGGEVVLTATSVSRACSTRKKAPLESL